MTRRGNMRSPRTPEEQAKMQIRLIKIGVKELDMADEVYRALVKKYSDGQCTSSTEMSEMQRSNLLNHIIAAGFTIKKKAALPSTNTNTDATYLKMKQLWAELHALGEVRNPAEGALRVYIKRQTGIDDPAWLNGKQSEKVIEALKKWRDRIQTALARNEVRDGH